MQRAWSSLGQVVHDMSIEDWHAVGGGHWQSTLWACAIAGKSSTALMLLEARSRGSPKARRLYRRGGAAATAQRMAAIKAATERAAAEALAAQVAAEERATEDALHWTWHDEKEADVGNRGMHAPSHTRDDAHGEGYGRTRAPDPSAGAASPPSRLDYQLVLSACAASADVKSAMDAFADAKMRRLHHEWGPAEFVPLMLACARAGRAC